MAEITLNSIKHSYLDEPSDSGDDWALKNMDLTWQDGGAYALLGSSGCGKTTLLNIISGLLRPSDGSILFDGQDVTTLSPTERNIAQVFQFPVVYDTMTVYDNLAFPLRNRGVAAAEVDRRVKEIAEMIDLEHVLKKRAAGLTADGKQKISLGRGLVRSDVNVIMFDEPLTVIDPHLKWQLRSKLKELHHEFGITMIYVTHDQTEALTFADQVVVMHDGAVVQMGTPVELFEKPQHTFVGHFIGSPGMNLLPATLDNGQIHFSNTPIEARAPANVDDCAQIQVGVRPEYLSFAEQGIPVRISKVDDIGRQKIVEARHQDQVLKVLLPEGQDVPGENACLAPDPQHTHFYINGWLYEDRA